MDARRWHQWYDEGSAVFFETWMGGGLGRAQGGYGEMVLRAKCILMTRESGFDVSVDKATREKFAETRYLESSIGKTRLLAIQPMLHMGHKDLWQPYMLRK